MGLSIVPLGTTGLQVTSPGIGTGAMAPSVGHVDGGELGGGGRD